MTKASLNLNQSKFGKYYENKKLLPPMIKKQTKNISKS